jgi:hypothetical protein
MKQLLFFLIIVTVVCSSFIESKNSFLWKRFETKTDTSFRKYKKNGFFYEDKFFKKKLISRNIFDGSKRLAYSFPINILTTSKTKYRFLSGRTYFDYNKIDTLEIINENLPYMNRGIAVSGVQLLWVAENLYQFKGQKVRPKILNKIELKVNIY